MAGNRINAKERGLTVSLNLLKTYIIIHVGYITHSHETRHMAHSVPPECHSFSYSLPAPLASREAGLHGLRQVF